MKKLRTIIAGTFLAILIAGCTDNARLQQAIASANFSLVGQDNGMGAHCDGFSLSRDTVILTYNYWPEEAGDSILASPGAVEAARPNARRGMQLQLERYPDVAAAMEKTGAGFIYRRKFADGHLDIYFTPSQVRRAIPASSAIHNPDKSIL